MAKRPWFKFPKRFNRPVSPQTKRLLARKHQALPRTKFASRWRRLSRSTQRGIEGWKCAAIRWSVVTVIGLAILTGGIVMFSPIGRIQEIRVTRTDTRLDIEGVGKTLSPLMGQYLVAVSVREVQNLLLENIPDLRSVSVSKRYPSQLLVKIELDPLIARMRVLNPDQEESAPSGSGSLSGYITDHGMFTIAPPGGQENSLPRFDLVDWGVKPEPNSELLSVDFLKRMWDTEDLLRDQFGMEVARRVVFLRAEEFHLFVQGRSLWFDIRSPVESQLQRFRTFLKMQGIDAAKQYVDLRPADKVVYR